MRKVGKPTSTRRCRIPNVRYMKCHKSAIVL